MWLGFWLVWLELKLSSESLPPEICLKCTTTRWGHGRSPLRYLKRLRGVRLRSLASSASVSPLALIHCFGWVVGTSRLLTTNRAYCQ